MSSLWCLNGQPLWAVRVEGEVRWQWAEALRTWWTTHQPSGPLIIDLRDCTILDSTMLGVLFMLADEHPPGRVILVMRVDQEIYYTPLGLMHLGQVQRTQAYPASAEWVALTRAPMDRTAASQTIIKAHEALIQLEAGNITAFRTLMSVLHASDPKPE